MCSRPPLNSALCQKQEGDVSMMILKKVLLLGALGSIVLALAAEVSELE